MKPKSKLALLALSSALVGLTSCLSLPYQQPCGHGYHQPSLGYEGGGYQAPPRTGGPLLVGGGAVRTVVCAGCRAQINKVPVGLPGLTCKRCGAYVDCGGGDYGGYTGGPSYGPMPYPQTGGPGYYPQGPRTGGRPYRDSYVPFDMGYRYDTPHRDGRYAVERKRRAAIHGWFDD